MSNRWPTLRQLQLVQALNQYKSISLVAQQLYVSQPSVSIQLRNLSELIGMPVYHTKGKKIELTDAGLNLLQCANEIFASLNTMNSKQEELKGLIAGNLKISVISTAKYFLPQILGAFCKKHPKVEVDLKIGNRKDLIERLESNEDDFYFFSHCPDDMDIIKTPFLDNELVVVAPARHELELQEEISLARLSHYPFIMREVGSGTRRSVELLCKEHGISLNEKMTIESNEAIILAVASGLGLSILSRHTLDYGHVPGIIKLNVKNLPIKSDWFLVQSKKRQQTMLAGAFKDFMTSKGQDILRKAQHN